jgi:large subunit ribosomal protein L23
MPRITKLLKRQLATEKSTKAEESQNKYVFEVQTSATEQSVTQEIARYYKVEVESVNLMILPGKKRRLRKTQRFARLPKWKKAIVALKEGQKIAVIKDDKKAKTKTEETK